VISISKDLENPDAFKEWQLDNPKERFRVIIIDKTLPQCGILVTLYVDTEGDIKYKFIPVRAQSPITDFSTFDKTMFETIKLSTDIPVELFQPFGMFVIRFNEWLKGYATGKCFLVDTAERIINPLGVEYES